eukprot:tig00000601_g2291.t1
MADPMPIDSGLTVTAAVQPPNPTSGAGLCEIDPSRLVIGQRLGRGAYGVVYKGSYMHEDVAIKEFNEYSSEFGSEFFIQFSIRHARVVQVKGAQTKQAPLRIIMELMDGDLCSAVLRRPDVELSLADRLRLMREICEGLCALHGISNNPVVHSDLKSLNVLVKRTGGPERFTCKLADFGLAAITQATRTAGLAPQDEAAGPSAQGGAGSFPWMAPEVMGGQQATRSSDVYSFATVCWEILTRQRPYADLRSVEIMGRVLGEAGQQGSLPHPLPPTAPTPSARPARPSARPGPPRSARRGRQLLGRCWSRSRFERATAEEALEVLRRLEAEATQAASALIMTHVDAYLHERAGGSAQNRDARLAARLCALVRGYERSARAAELLSAFAAEVQSRVPDEADAERLWREMRVVAMLPHVCELWAACLAAPAAPGPDGRPCWTRPALLDLARRLFNFVSLGDDQFREILEIAKQPQQGTYTADQVRDFCFWLLPAARTYSNLEELFREGSGRGRLGDAFLTFAAAQGRMAGQEPGAFVLRLSSQAWPDEAAGAVTITYKRHDGQLLNTRVPATLSTSDAVRDFIQSKSDVLQRSIFPQPRASNGEYISI